MCKSFVVLKRNLIYSNLLTKISRFHCRTDVVADQLKDLGVSDNLILKGGDLKSVEKLPQVDTSKIKKLARSFSGKKVLIAASTHKTDEKIVHKVLNYDGVYDGNLETV